MPRNLAEISARLHATTRQTYFGHFFVAQVVSQTASSLTQ